MSEPIVVTPSIRIPPRAISIRAVRASGHGGQNVNKVATRVELRVDTSAIEGLSEAARARLDASTRRRRDADGRLLVTSERTRHQARNIEDARDKLRGLVLAAARPPTPRTPTRPTSAARERRLREKRERAETKRWRAAREN